jgi:hypothetical protein
MLFNLQESRLHPNSGVELIRVLARVTRFVEPGPTSLATDERATYVKVEYTHDILPPALRAETRASRATFYMSTQAPVTWSASFRREPPNEPAIAFLTPPRRMISDLVRALAPFGERLEVERTIQNRPFTHWRSLALLEGRVLEVRDAQNNYRNGGEGDTLLRPLKPALWLWVDGHVVTFSPAEASIAQQGGDTIPQFVATRHENVGTPTHFVVHYSLQITATSQRFLARLRQSIPAPLANVTALTTLITDMF